MGLEPVEARHHYDGTLVQPAHVGGLGRIAATASIPKDDRTPLVHTYTATEYSDISRIDAIKQVQGRIEGDNAVSKADGGDSITFSFNDSEGKKVDISDVHADVTVYDFGLYKTQTEAEEHTLATFTVDPTVDGSTATQALSDVAAHLPANAADDDIQSLFIEPHYTSNGDDAAMVTTAMIDDFTDYQPPAQ